MLTAVLDEGTVVTMGAAAFHEEHDLPMSVTELAQITHPTLVPTRPVVEDETCQVLSLHSQHCPPNAQQTCEAVPSSWRDRYEA